MAEGAGPRAQAEAAAGNDCESLSAHSGGVEDQELADADNAGKKPFPKRAKFYGAYQYKTKFKKDWPFLNQYLVTHIVCRICSKTRSCGHQGVADVRDHTYTTSHLLLAKDTV